MSFEDQLGALAARLVYARNEIEASLQHVRESIHNRVDAFEADVALLHSKIQEMEDGVVRFRDQLQQAYQDDVVDLKDRVEKLEAALGILAAGK